MKHAVTITINDNIFFVENIGGVGIKEFIGSYGLIIYLSGEEIWLPEKDANGISYWPFSHKEVINKRDQLIDQISRLK